MTFSVNSEKQAVNFRATPATSTNFTKKPRSHFDVYGDVPGICLTEQLLRVPNQLSIAKAVWDTVPIIPQPE